MTRDRIRTYWPDDYPRLHDVLAGLWFAVLVAIALLFPY